MPDPATLWVVISVCSAASALAGGTLFLVFRSNRRTDNLVREFALDLADQYLEERGLIDGFLDITEQMAETDPDSRPRLEKAQTELRSRRHFIDTRQPLLRAFGGHQMSWAQIRGLFDEELPEELQEGA
jgi:hypothetical protein